MVFVPQNVEEYRKIILHSISTPTHSLLWPPVLIVVVAWSLLLQQLMMMMMIHVPIVCVDNSSSGDEHET